MAEIRAVTRSNARSIQALMEQQATDRLRHEEVISQIRELNANHDQRINLLENVSSRLTEVQLSMARMLSNIDQNQPTILNRLTNIENKVDQLLDQNQE